MPSDNSSSSSDDDHNNSNHVLFDLSSTIFYDIDCDQL